MVQRWRWAVTGAAVVMVASVGIGPAAATTADRTTEQKTGSGLTWGACPEDIAQQYPHLTCTTMKVPRDHANPSAGQLSLTLTKTPAKDSTKRRGTLILNTGGPGSSSIGYLGRLTKPNASGATRLPASILQSYDVVGFDARGVGHSSPISCVDPSFWGGPMPDPDAPAQRETLWKKFSGLGTACKEKVGDLLPHLGTISVAKDLDKIRGALGEKKISYLGFSYGTYLGTTYATLFPSRVDRMILDGVMNPEPKDLFYQAMLAQITPTFQRFGEWQEWAAKYDSVFHLGTTGAQVRQSWDKAMVELRRAPHGAVGPSELISLTYGQMFGEQGWIPFARAISDFVTKGDDKALVEMADPSPSAAGENGNAVFNAVTCVDSAWPKDRAVWERDAAKHQAAAPLIGWWNPWQNSACQSWPVRNQERVLPNGKYLPPVLLFGNKRDPSTPYAGAVRTHQLLPTSRLVTVDSGRHAAFAASGLEINQKVNEIGANYLVNGTLPGSDITVPGFAPPDPTKPAAAAKTPTARTPEWLGQPN